jgi:hypothetical protein
MGRVASHASHLQRQRLRRCAGMTELIAPSLRATARAYAVLSTVDDESAGGYFVTGTMKDLVPTW